MNFFENIKLNGVDTVDHFYDNNGNIWIYSRVYFNINDLNDDYFKWKKEYRAKIPTLKQVQSVNEWKLNYPLQFFYKEMTLDYVRVIFDNSNESYKKSSWKYRSGTIIDNSFSPNSEFNTADQEFFSNNKQLLLIKTAQPRMAIKKKYEFF